jgi:hypothetical protein
MHNGKTFCLSARFITENTEYVLVAFNINTVK